MHQQSSLALTYTSYMATCRLQPLANGDVAVILYNRGTDLDGNPTEGPKDVSVTWGQLWGDDSNVATGAVDDYSVTLRDLWAHAPVAPSDPATGHTTPVNPKDVVVLRAARSLS